MRMWSYTFIIRLNYSFLSLPMLALRKLSHYPKKTWNISYFCLCFFKIPKEKCFTCGWSKLLTCTWENTTISLSFSPFLLQSWMILCHVFSEFCLFLISGNTCRSVRKHGALWCCCQVCFLQMDSHFIVKVGCFFLKIPETEEEVFISLEIISGPVISFDLLEVFGFSFLNICRLKTCKEIWIRLGFLPFSLVLYFRLELLAHHK